MKKIPLLQAVATLLGATIGAGILSLPYVFSRAGFLTGLVCLIFVSLATTFVNLMFGEIVLRTKDNHQIAGYIGQYLGSFWQKVLSVFFSITLFGAMLAYFVGAGSALANLFGGQSIYWSLSFYFLGSLAIFFGLKIVKKISLGFSLLIFITFLVIIFQALGKINTSNLFVFDYAQIFIPLGVLLFAHSGTLAIPAMRRILVGHEKKIKIALLWGSLIPAVVYFIFVLAVVGVSGFNTTEVATIGLGDFLGPTILIMGSIFSLLTLSTAFLAVGLSLKDMFIFDWHIPWFWSWLLAIGLPLIIYFFGLHDFVKIISLVGSLGFGVEGIIYLFTYWRAKEKSQRRPEYALSNFVAWPATILIFMVFLSALIYNIIDLL